MCIRDRYKSTDLKQLAITSGVSAVFVLILVASNDLGGAVSYTHLQRTEVLK